MPPYYREELSSKEAAELQRDNEELKAQLDKQNKAIDDLKRQGDRTERGLMNNRVSFLSGTLAGVLSTTALVQGHTAQQVGETLDSPNMIAAGGAMNDTRPPTNTEADLQALIEDHTKAPPRWSLPQYSPFCREEEPFFLKDCFDLDTIHFAPEDLWFSEDPLVSIKQNQRTNSREVFYTIEIVE